MVTSDATTPASPLCFVIMPFGMKKDPKGGPDIDFNRIYEGAIRPAIVDAGMEPVRADAEQLGGIIHKAMFERLLLCNYAVADLTTANANVFYELGVRHAARPRTTVALCAFGHEAPFDVRYLRYQPYELGPANGFPDSSAVALRQQLSKSLRECREVSVQEAIADSPLFQLLQGYPIPDLAHLATDSFRDRARYSETTRERLLRARKDPNGEALSRLGDIQEELLQAVDEVELACLVDLLLSYRAVEAWEQMVQLHQRLPAELQRTAMIREQLAFACNRRAKPGDRERALDLLIAVEAERGANPETCGLIGRIHKDRFLAARETDAVAASGHLDAAIAAYLRGYQADCRDYYPGVNAVTLLDVRGEAEDLEQNERLQPVVQYALEQSVQGKPVASYWEHATQLELAVLRSDRAAARRHLVRAVTSVREAWEPKTTANNLDLVAWGRERRGGQTTWIRELMAELLKERS